MFSFSEAQDLADDITRLFEELDRRIGRGAHAASPVYNPPLDVAENASGIHVLVDLPGVEAGALLVVLKHGALVIAGEKQAAESACREGAAFHLMERSCGRFARVVRFDGAVDSASATAVLSDGVLRVTVPRREERRGREFVIPVETGPA